MKLLYLVRHAKSDWNNPRLDDFHRPLNARGEKDAPAMAQRLKDQGIGIQYILSSPAERALATAKQIALVLGYAEKQIATKSGLYHADADTLLTVTKDVNDCYQSIMLVGHNPGITQFANRLLNASIDNIPTCGIVAATLIVTSWQELSWGDGRQEFFDYPKHDRLNSD